MRYSQKNSKTKPKIPSETEKKKSTKKERLNIQREREADEEIREYGQIEDTKTNLSDS